VATPVKKRPSHDTRRQVVTTQPGRPPRPGWYPEPSETAGCLRRAAQTFEAPQTQLKPPHVAHPQGPDRVADASTAWPTPLRHRTLARPRGPYA